MSSCTGTPPFPRAASVGSGEPVHPRAAEDTGGLWVPRRCPSPPATAEATQHFWAVSNPWSKAEPRQGLLQPRSASQTFQITLKLPIRPDEPLASPIHFKVTAFLTLTAPSLKAGKLVPGPLQVGQPEEAEHRLVLLWVNNLKKSHRAEFGVEGAIFPFPHPLRHCFRTQGTWQHFEGKAQHRRKQRH